MSETLLVDAGRLTFGAMHPVLKATTNEIKCITLGDIPEPTTRPLAKVRGDMLIGAQQSLFGDEYTDPSFSHVQNVVEVFPPGLVEVISDDNQNLHCQRTPEGSLAAAYAGHRVRLGLDSGVPIRLVSGEPYTTRTDNGKQPIEALEARLVVLTNLLKFASSNWITTGTLNEINEQFGVFDYLTRRHILRLEAAGVVKVRINPEGRRKVDARQVRLVDEPRVEGGRTLLSPLETVHRHLSILKRFVLLDGSFVTEGLDHLDEIRTREDLVPTLVRRSLDSTSHTGKKRRS